jgi:hypothetical protein
MATKLRIYTATSVLPPHDVRTLVNARRGEFGDYQVYVLAHTRLEAATAIYHAFQGQTIETRELKVAADQDGTGANDSLGALIRAELFQNEGDVLVTDRNQHAGVVRVRGRAVDNGDPEHVGLWANAKDADDYTIKGFSRNDGAIFAEPVDELHKRVVLEDRAREVAKAAALTNVRDFLAAHKVLADAPKTTTDPDLIHSIGTNDRETGRIDLTITDLRILLDLAEGRR